MDVKLYNTNNRVVYRTVEPIDYDAHLSYYNYVISTVNLDEGFQAYYNGNGERPEGNIDAYNWESMGVKAYVYVPDNYVLTNLGYDYKEISSFKERIILKPGN